MAWHEIELVNRGPRRLRLTAEAPILDQIEASGLSLPFGCRRGLCLTCTARLEAGTVWHPAGVALNERDRAVGYVLLCVARAESDCRLRVGAAVHAELYANPFKSGASR